MFMVLKYIQNTLISLVNHAFFDIMPKMTLQVFSAFKRNKLIKKLLHGLNDLIITLELSALCHFIKQHNETEKPQILEKFGIF